MDSQLQPLFDKYNDKLKPIVAQIEGRFERFETPLLENLMNFWECIVQIYTSAHKDRAKILDRADRIIDECISQSYFYMISAYKDDVKHFERQTSKHTRERLDNGIFIGKYNSLKQIAAENISTTRLTCARKWLFFRSPYPNFIESYDHNKKAYEAYREISQLIDIQSTASIFHSSYRQSTLWSAIGWTAGIAISVLAGMYITQITDFIKQCLLN